MQVQNCLYYPLPGEPLDEIGPHLFSLTQSVEALSRVDVKRLYGDSALISAAALQLTQLARDIVRLHGQQADGQD